MLILRTKRMNEVLFMGEDRFLGGGGFHSMQKVELIILHRSSRLLFLVCARPCISFLLLLQQINHHYLTPEYFHHLKSKPQTH